MVNFVKDLLRGVSVVNFNKKGQLSCQAGTIDLSFKRCHCIQALNVVVNKLPSRLGSTQPTAY